jgi:hypothetical protein
MKHSFSAIIVCIVIFLLSTLSAQEKIEQTTKFEQFLSATGKIIRFEDTTMPTIKTSYENVTTRVRKVSAGPDVKYFFQLEKPTKYSSKTASLEYTDLIETIKAIDTLIAYSEKDKSSTVDYFENRFVADGFEIGYFKNKGISWFMDLAKYGSDGSVFFSDVSAVKAVFIAAKEKIDSMRGDK